MDFKAKSRLSSSYLPVFMQPQQQDTVIQAPETQRMTINPVFSLQWTVIAFIFAIIVCILFVYIRQENQLNSTLSKHYVTNKRLAKFIWLCVFSACN
ncbi:MAG: hypothetical protein OEW95_04020 [Candidatus Bathyarchaeota archaeon]|nr:hypothetical protein [Candidatus Bathyarchaeota archaeon]